ncbi:transcobalamin-2-like, partial [Saccoglossus kowalevskii]|uniref:Transcobalamin-2-like n=1 Tax=Saccoglossus kowalevskii TaxID=10224 RepID=A0ABM0M8B9_SACKO
MLSHLRMCMYNSTSGAEQSTDLPAGNLAYYVLALYSTCHDVSDFYGHDLLQLLKQKMHNFPVESFSNPFQYSLALLALCNAESYIDSSFVNMFKGLQDDDGSYFYGDVDTTAMAAMALTCMSHMAQFVNDATINATLDGCVDYLRSRQEPSGNYANIFASALSDQ